MSATFLANNGATALELQQVHNWKNPAMALEYVSNSRPHREKMAAKIQVAGTGPSTSTEVKESPGLPELAGPSISEETSEVQPPAKRKKSNENDKNVLSQASATQSTIGTMFGGFSNCNVTINVQK